MIYKLKEKVVSQFCHWRTWSDFLSFRSFSQNFEADTRTAEWAWVAMPPDLRMTSQIGLCPTNLDLWAFKEATRASEKVIFAILFSPFEAVDLRCLDSQRRLKVRRP